VELGETVVCPDYQFGNDVDADNSRKKMFASLQKDGHRDREVAAAAADVQNIARWGRCCPCARTAKKIVEDTQCFRMHVRRGNRLLVSNRLWRECVRIVRGGGEPIAWTGPHGFHDVLVVLLDVFLEYGVQHAIVRGLVDRERGRAMMPQRLVKEL